MMTTVLAAVLALGLGQQEADPVLDLEFGGVRLSEFMAHLSEETGQAHAVSPELKDEVLAIWVPGMKLSDVRERVADVFYGRWVNQTQGLTLVVDANRIKREADERAAVRLQWVRESKAVLRAFLNGTLRRQYTMDDETYDRYMRHWNTPEGKMYIRTMLALPDQAFARLTPGERVVYSTRPNAMQRAFVLNGVDDIVRDWVGEANDSVREELKQWGDDPDILRYERIIQDVFGRAVRPELITGAPAKVLAAISSPEGDDDRYMGMPDVEVMVVDAEGRVLVSLTERVDSLMTLLARVERYSQREDEDDGGGMYDDSDEPVDRGPRVKLEEETYRYLQVFESWRGREKPQWMAETLAVVADPVETEPLRLMVGEPILAVAKEEKTPVVACLDDDQAFWFIREAPNGMLPKDEVYWILEEPTSLRKTLETYVTEDWEGNDVHTPFVRNGVWTLRTASPGGGKRIRRQDLKDLVGVWLENGKAPLDILGNFAARNPFAEHITLYGSYREVFASGEARYWSDDEPDWEDLVFWGNLSTTQRETLRRGGSVRAGELAEGAQGVLVRAVFHSGDPLDPVNPGRARTVFSGVLEGVFSAASDIRSYEVTELMPQGLPRQTVVSGLSRSESYLVVTDDYEGENYTESMGPGEFALYKKMYAEDKFDEALRVELGSVWSGQRTEIHLTVQVVSGLGFEMALMDSGKVDKSKTYSWPTLPAGFMRDVEAALRLYDNSPIGQLLDMFTGEESGYTPPVARP